MEWAETTAGKRPAKEFYEGLDDEDKAKALALFKRFADHGRITNREKFKKLQDGLFELKSYQVRFLGDHRPGHRFIVATGIKKKRDNHKRKDLKRAHEVLAENDRREQV